MRLLKKEHERPVQLRLGLYDYEAKNRKMKSTDIRRKFLEFFQERGHRIAPSASLVPADPTLLLTGAGMVPFKPIFMGKAAVDFSRAASAQKCVRTTDIELIGLTGRHLSFFEMLGNFSFGDYYKREAITWAWELLTGVFGLPADSLSVSIFETDDETAEIWRSEIGLAEGRIKRLGEKDNFWAAGPTGPCGPCSEIYYDQGQGVGCGHDGCGVGCDCDRFLEVWNLVFMQYNRDEAGELHPLPKKSIDTGMGLERIASVLQGVPNNYETDLLRPLIDLISEISKTAFGSDEKKDVSIRIIADHARALTFMISDGILPGNDGRGYILRRLARRAVRHGRLLGIETSFLPRIADEIVAIMVDAYPDLRQSADFIKTVAAREEERFSETLRQGLAILGEVIEEVRAAGETRLPAEAVFKLYDTYGFPLELTEEIGAESGFPVDRAGFDVLMGEQRARARAKAGAGHAQIFVSNIYHEVREEIGPTDFVGYENASAQAKIAALARGEQVKMGAAAGESVEVFLDQTPFYAEKGGQVGDAGYIISETGKVKIDDTKAPIADLIAHSGTVVEGRVEPGQTVSAVIDDQRRRAISRNHTATHMLHWALRTVLGSHVKQAGSLVQEGRLRFDFNHHAPLTEDQLAAVEKLVNEKVLQSVPVRAFETTMDYAQEVGALAFFGDKYGKFVRLVEVGSFSKELCGGVHVHNSSEVGYVKVINETGIGANTRRLEAVSGAGFLDYTAAQTDLLRRAAALLNTRTTDIEEALVALTEKFNQQEDELAALRSARLIEEAEAIAGQGERIDGITLYTGNVARVDIDGLRTLADRLRSKSERAAVVLTSGGNGKTVVLVAAAPGAVENGFRANDLVRKLGPIIGGGGGGRPDLAQAGGKYSGDPEKIFEQARRFTADLFEQ